MSPKRGAIGLALSLLCVLLPTAQAAAQVREGILRVTAADNPQAGLETISYSLRENGATVQVLPTTPTQALSGQRVRVTGSLLDGAFVGAVAAVEPAIATSTTELDTRTVAVILFKYPDEAIYSGLADDIRRSMFTTQNSARAFYEAESHGRLSFGGIEHADGDFFGPYVIARDSCNVGEIAETEGVDLDAYDYRMYVYPTGDECLEEATARGEVGGANSWYSGAVSSGTFAHELGHNLGARHANADYCVGPGGDQVTLSDDCESREYGDPFDIMGSDCYCFQNVYYQNRFGLVPDSQIRTVAEDGTFAIEPQADPGAGVTMLRIPDLRDPEGVASWYLVELKAAAPPFELEDAATSGVSIRSVVRGEAGPTLLYDGQPGEPPPGEGPFIDAPLPAGRSFDDGVVRIDVDSVDPGEDALVSVTFNSSADSLPPTAPTFLSGEMKGGDAVLEWGGASDNLYVARCVVLRDGVQIATVPCEEPCCLVTFTDHGVPPGTHAYSVYAVDEAGNQGPPSEPLVLMALDVTPPSAPGGLTATASGDQIALSWASSSDDVGVSEYRIGRDGHFVGGTAETQFTEAGLLPGSYRFSVQARDLAGNFSPAATVSASVAARPAGAGPSAPPPPPATSPPTVAVAGHPSPLVALLTWRRGRHGKIVFHALARGGTGRRSLQLFVGRRRLAARAADSLRAVWLPPGALRRVRVRVRASDEAGAKATVGRWLTFGTK